MQPADCRLHVFEGASEATRIWIKGRGFSVRQLLGTLADSMDLQGCSLAISRCTACLRTIFPWRLIDLMPCSILAPLWRMRLGARRAMGRS